MKPGIHQSKGLCGPRTGVTAPFVVQSIESGTATWWRPRRDLSCRGGSWARFSGAVRLEIKSSVVMSENSLWPSVYDRPPLLCSWMMRSFWMNTESAFFSSMGVAYCLLNVIFHCANALRASTTLVAGTLTLMVSRDAQTIFIAMRVQGYPCGPGKTPGTPSADVKADRDSQSKRPASAVCFHVCSVFVREYYRFP